MNYLPVVVSAVVPQPPQLSLLLSAVRPPDIDDPTYANPDSSAFLPDAIRGALASRPPLADISDEQMAMLPEELRLELEAREGARWTRGFTWAPENRYPAEARSGCDYSTVDLPALTTPTGLAVTPSGTGSGTSYQVTAVNANGETQPCTAVTKSTGSTGTNVLTWKDQGDAQFNVYGRIGGSIGLIATVGPFTEGAQPTYSDLGSISPGAAPPSSNTTGGPGVYVNQAVQVCIPWVLVTEDWCSAFGWAARDFKGRARRLLENSQHYALGSEFWTGALAQAQSWPNNYLTNSATVTDLTPGTVPSAVRGLEILQDALANHGFGGQGMIHCQPQVAPSLLNQDPSGRSRALGKLLDTFDNIIVPDPGYPGTAPGGGAADAGTTWMYATDLIGVRLEKDATVIPDTFSEALDRGQAGEPNTIRFRAMKFGAAYGDFAVHYACKVNLPS